MKEIYMDPTGFKPVQLEIFNIVCRSLYQRSYTFVFIHQSDYCNKINLLLYSAATNMRWINLKALTSEAVALL